MSNFRYTRPDGFPPVIKNLIIINVLVFVAQLSLDNQYDITNKFALYPIDSPDGSNFKPYQIFTHMFTHAPTFFFHILFNMINLWMFGRILENVWGQKRFLAFYLACGIGAAAIHLLICHLRYDPEIFNRIVSAELAGDEALKAKLISQARGFMAPIIGASGAVMGVMAAFGYLFPNTQLIIPFFYIPIKAKWLIMGLIAADIFGGVSPTAGSNIAHFAHIGGALTGFLIVFIWNKTNRRSLY